MNLLNQTNEPIIVADRITKLYPYRQKRKIRRGETIFSYFRKELEFGKQRNMFKALDNVSFSVYPGETVAIIGRNGSGKSTLLRVLTGLTKPTAGYAWVNASFGELFSLNSGFDKNLTGRQNIYLYAALKGTSRREIEKQVDAIIEFSELGEFIDQPIKTYSSGMRSRLGFSLTTAILPKVMFIDEALGTGDARFREKCDERIKSMTRDESRTFVIVSHSMNNMRELCSRAIWLDKGVIQLDGEVNAVVDAYLDAFQIRKKPKKESLDG